MERRARRGFQWRTLLVVARDVVCLAIGTAGVIHEEFYTTSERLGLISLYGALLAGVTLVNGRKLAQVISRAAAAEDGPEDEPITPSRTPAPLPSSAE